MRCLGPGAPHLASQRPKPSGSSPDASEAPGTNPRRFTWIPQGCALMQTESSQALSTLPIAPCRDVPMGLGHTAAFNSLPLSFSWKQGEGRLPTITVALVCLSQIIYYLHMLGRKLQNAVMQPGIDCLGHVPFQMPNYTPCATCSKLLNDQVTSHSWVYRRSMVSNR